MPPDDSPLNRACTRSVDNLQRLYTVVVSLAVTESLRRLMTDSMHPNAALHPGADSWLMFVSLMATIIPFYHGANRYLDATYVTRERTAPHHMLMVDFLVLFAEGLIFFGLAMLVGSERHFYTLLSALLILDAVWVGFTRLTSEEKGPPSYWWWAGVNLLIALGLFVVVWSRLFEASMWKVAHAGGIAACLLTIGRTIYDYCSVWEFYYPAGLIPAPQPAMPPKHEDSDAQSANCAGAP